jgi:hypothetical protein
MATRSRKLFAGGVFGPGPLNLATVPAGETWILKHVSVSNFTGAGDTVMFGVQDAALNQIWLIPTQALPTGQILLWSGFVVLQSTDSLFGGSNLGAGKVWASGAKLPG